MKINQITYNLSSTLQGTAFATRDADTGVYLCSLVCENPSRTYKIKINGFCAPRTSFQAPILSDKFIAKLCPSEDLSLIITDKIVIDLRFFGITSTNELSPVEVLESCE
uniref:Uncharacterized protein n=1 Tax=Rhipiliopsis peltata TaxID=2320810 RepID=A0A386B1D4_9CHLO|nr:hypothetical protein [Rhipiliopsis peltata]AYC65506.1 hypothetical protein [Rhipiliopsis peltata]